MDDYIEVIPSNPADQEIADVFTKLMNLSTVDFIKMVCPDIEMSPWHEKMLDASCSSGQAMNLLRKYGRH